MSVSNWFDPLPQGPQICESHSLCAPLPPHEAPLVGEVGPIFRLIRPLGLITPQGVLRDGTEVMDERFTSHRYLETGLACAQEKIRIFKLADPEILVEHANRFKDTPAHHKTDPVGDAPPRHILQ